MGCSRGADGRGRGAADARRAGPGKQEQSEMFGLAFDTSQRQLRLKEHGLIRRNCMRTRARGCVQTFANQLVAWQKEVRPADAPPRSPKWYGRVMIQQLPFFQSVSGGTDQDVPGSVPGSLAP